MSSVQSDIADKPATSGFATVKSLFGKIPLVYPLFALLLLAAYIERPMMLAPLFFFTIMRQAVPLILVTIGQSLCMRIRSLDLSSGGVIVGAAYILTSGWIQAPTPVLIALALALGLAVGAVNAWFIAIRRSSAVLVTLATAMIVGGTVLVLSGILQPDRSPQALVDLARFRIGKVPMLPILAFALAGLIALAVRSSVLGRYIDAIGANPRAAWVSGLPYVRVVFLVHMTSGLLSALAAMALVGTLGKGSVILGQDLPLFSLAAVVLGGVSFGYGKGGVLGPVFASAMLIFLFNFLTAYNFAQPVRLILVGIVILISAIAISHRARNE